MTTRIFLVHALFVLGACELSTKNLGDPTGASESAGFSTGGGSEGGSSTSVGSGATSSEPLTTSAGPTSADPSAGPTSADPGATTSTTSTTSTTGFDPMSDTSFVTESSTGESSASSTGPVMLDVGTGDCDDPLSYPGVTKLCAEEADCAVVFHQVDCCGSLAAIGVQKDSVDPFNAAEAECVAPLPVCDCAPMPTTAEAGGSTAENDTIVAHCVDNQCQSALP